MNYLDLFAGIGGFGLGARRAGMVFENHLFSEIEPYAISVYKKNFPEAINLGDIKKIDGNKLKKQYGKNWFITGGFPCQDLSTAGKQRGINAERSGLWWEMYSVIRELQPKATLIENVPALTTQGLDRILCSLTEIGYDAEWQTISARDIGGCHKRERLWIIAYPMRDRVNRPIELLTINRDLEEIAQTDHKIDVHSIQFDWKAEATKRIFCGQPVVRRENDGVSLELDRARLKCLGNAIVPQIAEMISRRIKNEFTGF